MTTMAWALDVTGDVLAWVPVEFGADDSVAVLALSVVADRPPGMPVALYHRDGDEGVARWLAVEGNESEANRRFALWSPPSPAVGDGKDNTSGE